MSPRPRTTFTGRARPRLETLEDRWNPANPVVSNTNDAGDGSLRAAVAVVNNGGDPAPQNTSTFQLPGEAGWDINLQSELAINANVTITGPDVGGLPLLTLHGSKAGSGILLRGNRVFTVGEGRSVTLIKMNLLDGAAPFYDPNGGLIKVLSNGSLTVRQSSLWGGVAYNDGGGIWCGPVAS
jgi:hypothetical protein